MKHLHAILAALLLAAAATQAQTLKSLMYNTTNGVVAYSSTNTLAFTNPFKFGTDLLLSNNIFTWDGSARWAPEDNTFFTAIGFDTTNIAATTRTNLGLGAANDVVFNSISFGGSGTSRLTNDSFYFSTNLIFSIEDASFSVPINALAGLTNNGNITVTQTTASNGLLFVYRTNNEAFLGLANLIASNNTTLSNETLFRVGVAEATNKSAQFGFRTVRTNNGGEGLAVFSVFGYNALMMIGPSDRSRTNTATNAGIEADIWTITPTNRVMTLRDTNSGAVTLHQELGWSTNNITTNAPANTTNVALWLRVWVGTNNYRLPLYQ